MEQILGIIVFGALIAVCVIGLQRSRKASATGGGDAFAMVAGREKGGSAGGSPGRKTEDHATLSETSEPTGLRKDEVTSPDKRETDIGKQRPQAERPLGSGDA